jgi:hypothetical protein
VLAAAVATADELRRRLLEPTAVISKDREAHAKSKLHIAAVRTLRAGAVQ